MIMRAMTAAAWGNATDYAVCGNSLRVFGGVYYAIVRSTAGYCAILKLKRNKNNADKAKHRQDVSSTIDNGSI